MDNSIQDDQVINTLKVCTKCKLEFPKTNIWFRERRVRYKDTTYYSYYSRCRNCEREDCRDNYNDNIDIRRQNSLDYSKNHIENRRKNNQNWLIENREKVRNKNQHRYSHKRSLLHDFTAHDWETCLDYWDYKCAYCGCDLSKLPSNQVQQDHVIPVVKNGGYTRSNIVPACESCNTSKNDKDLGMWAQWKFPDSYKDISMSIELYFLEIDR